MCTIVYHRHTGGGAYQTPEWFLSVPCGTSTLQRDVAEHLLEPPSYKWLTLVKIGRQAVEKAARDAECVAQAVDADIFVDCVQYRDMSRATKIKTRPMSRAP